MFLPLPVPLLRMLLLLVVLQLPGVRAMRPEADNGMLQVHAGGSFVHLKGKLHLDTAGLAHNTTASGDPATASPTDADQAPQNAQSEYWQMKQRLVEEAKKKGKSLTGVSKNKKTDLTAWISTVTTSLAMSLGCLAMFHMLRKTWRDFPLIYANNTLNGLVPAHLKPDQSSAFGWIRAVQSISRDEAEDAIGLDCAFLMEFWKMSIQMTASSCLVYCTIFIQLDYWFGSEAISPLGETDFGNLPEGSWVFWPHSLGVWYMMVLVVETMMSWHLEFLKRRTLWLQAMAPPRSTTVLVEEIPPHLRSDAALHDYFQAMFGEGSIECTHLVKNTKRLVKLQTAWNQLQEKKLEAESTWELADNKPECRPTCKSTDGLKGLSFMNRISNTEPETVDMINHYNSLMEQCSQEMATERRRIRKEVAQEGEDLKQQRNLHVPRSVTSAANLHETIGEAAMIAMEKKVCTSAAFVTFKSRRDAAVARMVNCKQNTQELITGDPPDPADIRYQDFMVNQAHRAFWSVTGYILIALLFFGFLPIVVIVQSFSNIDAWREHIPLLGVICDEYPVLQSIIEGVLSSLGLNFLNGLIPTILLAIFEGCFTLRAYAWTQVTLHIWYFWFQVIYIVLVTAIGTSLIDTAKTLASNPTELPHLLATTLPYSTHFYLNFLSIHWGSVFLDFTRYLQVSKFVAFRVLFKDSEKAREMSEPEDQSYHGIGSRCARSSILLIIMIIYGPLCPFVMVCSLIDFTILRHALGYLIVFAETRKPDLGGVFWVQMLRQVFYGLFIYSILMFGLLHARGPVLLERSWLSPGTLVIPATIYLYIRYSHFEALQWSILPFEEAIKEDCDLKVKQQEPTRLTYEQPELTEVTDSQGPTGAASSSAVFGDAAVGPKNMPPDLDATGSVDEPKDANEVDRSKERTVLLDTGTTAEFAEEPVGN